MLWHPRAAAVRAAPTVPECRTARPAFAPGLMPDSTRSGGGPKAPSTAMTTMNAGAPATAYPIGLFSMRTRPLVVTAWREALIPLYSVSGAATATSWPAERAAAARTARPGDEMPSSLVTRIRIRRLANLSRGRGRRAAEQQRPAVTEPSGERHRRHHPLSRPGRKDYVRSSRDL